MRYGVFATLAVMAAISSTLVSTSHADDLWKAEYRKATAVEASILVTIGVVAFVGEYTVKEPQSPRIHGGVLFDQRVRDSWHASSEAGRARASKISDIGFWGLTALPFVDAAVSAWGVHRDGDTAVQLAIMDAEAFSVDEALTFVTKLATARQRPYAYDAGCPVSGCIANTSFPSGHTSRSFTGAALICTTHAYIPMYGGPWDAIACAAGIGAATTTGIMRIVADKHWMTDVLAGSLVGSLSGWLVPTLFHFHAPGHTKTPAPKAGSIRVWPVFAKSAEGLGFTLGMAGIAL